MEANKNYDQLHALSRHASILSGVSSLLHWDQETYMPPAANGIRSTQLETLAGIVHDARTNKQYEQALSKLIDLKTGQICDSKLSTAQQAALKEWRRDYLKETALPKEFVEEWAKLTCQAINAWQIAKKENSFQRFAPFLDRLISMARKKADYYGYDKNPYDALLDSYEPGTTTAEVAAVFKELRQSLTVLLSKIKNGKPVDDSFLFGKFSSTKQLKFGRKLLQDMGYDFAKGRLDFSAHPFSSSCHPTDSRITTRLHPTSVMDNITVVLHEGGHSLYEMGLPPEQYGSPLGEAVSLGIHESQSRWWETRIGMSKAFWEHYYPILQKEFKQFKGVSLSDFYRGINRVKPSLIRVEADEVTYALHVILRFELEQDLIQNKLSVRELPEAWNAKMNELLGITPPNNAVGCLQDIHWSMGAFGYFPTYALGNLYAAHFFIAFEKEFLDWEKRVAAGELGFIREWLHRSIYQYGRQYTSLELLKKVNGKPFSADAFVHYLNKKYQNIYSFN